ncbi:acetyltransferase (GNAT) family protein [Sarocladium implicatum]|nr:acetyltransferase (GNAT) family protein [Sarocladium implicatum]
MEMELDSSTDAGAFHGDGTIVRVMQDRQGWLPLSNILAQDDVVLLLTPLVEPEKQEVEALQDPFESLGQKLSQHFRVRHVPYTKSAGITGIHAAFAKRVKATVCVITRLAVEDEVSQPHLAALMAYLCEHRPFVVVACCTVSKEAVELCDFPAVIIAPGYSEDHLGPVSSALSDGGQVPALAADPMMEDPAGDVTWAIEDWDAQRDTEATHSLWLAAMPHCFRLDRPTLDGLLIRPGFAKHLVARESKRGLLVGFCAVYTTYADSGGVNRLCSIAAIMVREEYRGKGIGTHLHNEAIDRFQLTRGLNRVQLGAPFPRLLYGIPLDLPMRKWFENKGWVTHENSQGRGRIVADWVLRLTDLPTVELASAGLTFRRCEFTDFQDVLNMTAKETDKKLHFGLYDQYARTLDSAHMENIILAFEGATLAAAAITYTPNDGSISATDIPWPATMGSDIGGITCICFNDDDPEVVNRRDTIMVRLLHACARSLRERGMVGIFADGLKLNDYTLESQGFTKWAEYYEVWRQV